jgi:hypothetical protein
MAEYKTTEEMNIKAAELSKEFGVTVHAICFMGPDKENIVGFIKEPSRIVKYRFLDKAMSPMSAAVELLEALLIKKDSDPKIYSESPDDDLYNIGAATSCAALINVSTDMLKKN